MSDISSAKNVLVKMASITHSHLCIMCSNIGSDQRLHYQLLLISCYYDIFKNVALKLLSKCSLQALNDIN